MSKKTGSKDPITMGDLIHQLYDHNQLQANVVRGKLQGRSTADLARMLGTGALQVDNAYIGGLRALLSITTKGACDTWGDELRAAGDAISDKAAKADDLATNESD